MVILACGDLMPHSIGMSHPKIESILLALNDHQARLLQLIESARAAGHPAGVLEASLWRSRGRTLAMQDHLNGHPLVMRSTD